MRKTKSKVTRNLNCDFLKIILHRRLHHCCSLFPLLMSSRGAESLRSIIMNLDQRPRCSEDEFKCNARAGARTWLGRTEGHSWSADRALSFWSRRPLRTVEARSLPREKYASRTTLRIFSTVCIGVMHACTHIIVMRTRNAYDRQCVRMQRRKILSFHGRRSAALTVKAKSRVAFSEKDTRQ